MNTKKQVGARIRQAREDLDLTQTQFAFKVQSAARTVQSWEDGSRVPQIPTFERIAVLTGRPISWFFESDELEPVA